MKNRFKYAFLAIPLAGSPLLWGEQQPALLSDPPDGTAPPAQEVRYAFKPAEVLESKTVREGGRNITVQRLALDPNDPVIPVRKSVAPAAPIPQPEGGQIVTPSFHLLLLLLSATVYPGPVTRLRWTHHFEDGTAHEYSGWSNVDFNHFCGVSSFIGTDGKEHVFQMGIGTESESAADVPQFETTAPTFIAHQQNIPAEALVTVDSLHKLYALEKVKLAAAHEGRKLAEAAHAADLIANPPQPKDLIIRYRIAETPLDNEGGAQ